MQMLHRLHTLLGVFLLTVLSCTSPEVIDLPVSQGPLIEKISFLQQDNPGLTAAIHLDYHAGRFYGRVPIEAHIHSLVASFEAKEGCKIEVNGIPQESGITANDFAPILQYTAILPGDTTEVFEVDVQYFTGLPIVYLKTTGGKPILSKEDYITGSVSIAGGRHFDDLAEKAIEIRGRGNSTWFLHPKKPYQIKFDDKTPFLGMPADKRWLFLAEYSDKSFMRNRIAFEMGYLSKLEWTPESDFAEVFLNGQHQGLYHITQKVEESKNRVNITNDGYLLEIDQLERIDPDDVYFYSDHFLINIKEPELIKNSPEYDYIRDYIRDFEDALFGPNFKDPVIGYQKYIDVESMVDWFLINEIAKNVDAKSFASIFMYLAPGQKLKMGPLWDFDLGFGNVNYADPEYPTGFWVLYHPWISRMLEDPFFVFKVKQRFAYFNSREDKLYELMDSYVPYLYLSQWENDQIWHTLGVWVWPNAQVFNTWEEELAYLKDWIGTRLDWMAGAIDKL